MRRTLAILCVCVTLLPWLPRTSMAAGQASVATQVTALLKTAQLAFDKKNYREALVEFTEVTRLAPKNAAGWAGKARSEAYLDDNAGAVRDYDVAVSLAPRNALYIYRRAVSEGEIGNSGAALRDDNQAIRLDSKLADAYFNRAEIYYNRDQYSLSLADNMVALRLESNWWPGYLNRAEDYLMLSMWQQAIADYTVYIRHAVRFACACAYIERGNAYEELAEYQKAFSDYQQAFAIGPVCCLDYAHYGEAAYYLHKYPLAVSLLSITIADDDDGWPFYYRGLARQQTGDIADAIRDEQMAEKLDEAQGNTYNAALDKSALQQLMSAAPVPSVSLTATQTSTGMATRYPSETATPTTSATTPIATGTPTQ